LLRNRFEQFISIVAAPTDKTSMMPVAHSASLRARIECAPSLIIMINHAHTILAHRTDTHIITNRRIIVLYR
jgi:hypothetical protein